MSIPNAALHKLVLEIENQASLAQQQINIVKTQMASKQREMRMLQLTSTEVSNLPSETNVYEGVGKMFVASPTTVVDERLKTETLELKMNIENLGKRLLYLETTHKNSKEHVGQILKHGGSA